MRKKAQQLDLFGAFGGEPKQEEVTKAVSPSPPPPPPEKVVLKAPSPPAQVYAESIVEEKAPALIKKAGPSQSAVVKEEGNPFVTWMQKWI